ncbi:transmembrane protease serine 9-like [Aedes albopictus]|uniref:Peptidase S1 domain-containing protein n=1 Tax=Aedes albopictus TaxID=7160 RepID=A0ABM1XK44_AEDAL
MYHKYRLGRTAYACGVTILTERFVLTAAHCTYERWKKLPADRVFVKVGLSNLDSPEDHMRQFEVDKITRHKQYNMDTFENDIALLKLSWEITYTNYIQPACLWQGDSELSKIISKIGFVVGWGLVDGYSLPKELSETTMPIVSRKKCMESDKRHYNKYYFKSKTFCAGCYNGSHTSHGDSGGGLYMRMGSSWVLRGIVSNAKINASTLKIQSDSYTIFTDVAYYLNWIKKKVPAIPYLAVDTKLITETDFDYMNCSKVTYPSGTQQEREELVNLAYILNGSQSAETAESCGEKKTVVQQLIANGYKTFTGSWPWHGAMFRRYKDGAILYTCGVTIMTEQFVITAAHCTFDGENKLLADHVLIKVGINNLDSPERHVQQHDVDVIIRHEDFNNITSENDIAILKLYSEITYNSYIQSICLWQGDTQSSKLISQVGYIVGWGLNEDYRMPQDLNEATVQIVSRRECIESDRSHFSKFSFESKTFCAGHRNGTQITQGDSGGGLFIRVGLNWVLRGIVSNALLDDDLLHVSEDSYVVFTDVAFYMSWIISKVTIMTRSTIDIGPIAEHPGSTSLANSGSQANLLEIANCGKDKYPSETPEEVKGYLNQYPWLAVVEYINMNTRVLEVVCHGVLIHPSFLITAAHCVQKKRLSVIRSVRLNDYDLNSVTDIFQIDGETNTLLTATRIAVSSVFIHPDYDTLKFESPSIAVIKLHKPTTTTPICLAPRDATDLPKDKKFTIIGWKRYNRSKKPMIRNEVQLVSFAECRRKYAAEKIVLDSTGGQVCGTFSRDDDSSSCSRYLASAPFQYVMNGPFEGRYFLAAISSFGHKNCSFAELPDVFTNVAHYSDWIYEKVRQNE